MEKSPEYLAAEARYLAFRQASNDIFDALDDRRRALVKELDRIAEKHGLSAPRHPTPSSSRHTAE